MRVFIVEDVPFIREILRGCLQRLGHQVVGESGDGSHALKQILNERPDVVFIDLILPGKNGVELARELQAIDSTIRLIAFSALNQDYIINQALEAGCATFMAKPFSLQDVKRVIDGTFEMSQEAANE